MDAEMEVPSTSGGDLEPGVSQQTLDGTAQDSTHRTEQPSGTPTIVQKSELPEQHNLDSSPESIPFSQAQVEERSLDGETTDDENNSTNTTSRPPRSLTPEPLPQTTRRRRPRDDSYTYPHLQPPMHVPAMPPPPEDRIMHMGNTEFNQKRTFSAIEVLLEEPMVTMRSRQKIRSFRNLTLQSADSSQIQPITKPNPRKIRIRSPILLKLLEEIAKIRGLGFFATNPHFVDVYNPTIFLHPFKLFAHLEPDIRAKLAELGAEVKEAKNEAVKQKDGDDGSPHSGNISGLCELCGHNPNQLVVTDSERAGRLGGDDHEDNLSSPSPSQTQTVEEPTKSEQLKHLQMLIEVFDSDLKPMFDLRRDIKEETLTHIAFQDLWHLFQYGQDVRMNDNESQVYRVVRWTGGRPHHLPPPPGQPRAQIESAGAYSLNFHVDCVYLDFDGHLYAPGYKTSVIRKYEGEKAVTSLPIFPIAFGPNHVKFRRRLAARGDTWLQLTQPGKSTHKHYTGLTLDLPQAYEIDSQIIVDAKMAILHCFNSPVPNQATLTDHDHGETVEEPDITNRFEENMSIHQDYVWDMHYEQVFFKDHKSWLSPTTDVEEIEDEDRILLPPHVLGFVLRSRKWARFNIELIQPVKYTSGFDALVLPDGHKETVRALVATHARTPIMPEKSLYAENSIDLVRGKGEGLVILLHGAPGVGKTSTAECVADNTKRPLFPITCGDIGDTATDVERNLENSFQLAHKWDCVLLLNEADIFLQKRDKVDIKRNAIVSVFLRTLEYYRGILFLTTNRVGTFDPAFRSRIHVSLYYPPLKKDATMQIWKMHLRRTQTLKGQDENVDFRINSREILKFAKEHYYDLKKNGAGSWNGRQIRNAFQTAIALAEFHAAESQNHSSKSTHLKIELGKTHFLTVAQASKDFDDYLQRTLGGQNEADMARNEQTRLDDFDSPKVVRRAQGKKKKKKVVENVESEESERDSEDSEDEESGSESESKSESEEEAEVVQVVKKVVKKRGR